MKPDLANITSFKIIIRAEWYEKPAQPSPVLKWAEDMKRRCRNCPLACFPHPMVPESHNRHNYAKLCTLSVIAAGFLSLEEIIFVVGDPLYDVALFWIEKMKPDYDALDARIVSEKQQIITEKQLIVSQKQQNVQEPLAFSYKYNWAPQYVAAVKKSQKQLKKTPDTTLQLTLFEALDEMKYQDSLFSQLEGRGFYSDEAKILCAGFSLVRYAREEKRIYQVLTDGPITYCWLKGLPFATYAAAEKTLAQLLLTNPLCIQVSESGQVTGYKNINKLGAAGFDLYRSEGIIPGHGTPRIKCFSKNWGNWNKYASGEEVKAAWDELMKDKKALQG